VTDLLALREIGGSIDHNNLVGGIGSPGWVLAVDGFI
jgi:hypothetical protein